MKFIDKVYAKLIGEEKPIQEQSASLGYLTVTEEKRKTHGRTIEYRIEIKYGTNFFLRSESKEELDYMRNKVAASFNNELYGEVREKMMELYNHVYSEDRVSALKVMDHIIKEISY